MRLIDNIAARLAMALLPVIALWAMIFYFVMLDEINDEADDLLENYSEQLIVKKLSGDELPAANVMTDKHYRLSSVSPSYADAHDGMEYYDADFLMEETDESEPARFLRTIFKDREGNCFELTVCTPTFEKDDLTKTILWWILALYLLLLLTVIVITLAVLQKSMRPFYRILDWLSGYTPGQPRGSLEITTDVSEFTRLEKTVSEMADRSEDAFEKQKQFIGNASHELQTPLAILGGRIDWMLDNEPLTESATGEMVQMKRTLGNIVRLNKTLLLLTKIDNGQFPETGDVNLGELIVGQVNIFSDIFAKKGIGCTTSIPEEPAIIRMNETLASIMISNLIKNAFIHSPEGGKINVSLTENGLAVENTGTIPLDSGKIFERFHQGAKKEGSTGLGLAIAKTIADRNGIILTYSFVNGFHRFALDFNSLSRDRNQFSR